MAHFAKLDSNNIVTDVIVSEKDFINSGVVGDEFLWIQTSYNNNFRKQFGGIGDTYDVTKNKFIKPQPFPSWTLDSSDDWQPPTALPDDSKRYEWNEDTTNWVEVV
jgi:hypothetical protein